MRLHVSLPGPSAIAEFLFTSTAAAATAVSARTASTFTSKRALR